LIFTPGTLPNAGKFQLYEVTTGKSLLTQSLEHNRPVCAVNFLPDGKNFVVAYGIQGNVSEKAEAHFWSLYGHDNPKSLQLPCAALSVAFSPNGTRLLTGHWDFKARLWNLASPEDPVVLHHDAPVGNVAFIPDGKTLLTGCFDGTVRISDLMGQT